MSTDSFMELELRSGCSGKHYSLVPVSDLPRLWLLMGLQQPETPSKGIIFTSKKNVSPIPTFPLTSISDNTIPESLPGMVLRSDCSETHYSLLTADMLKLWEAFGLVRPEPLPRGFLASKL